MVKKIAFILSIIISAHVHAMEVGREDLPAHIKELENALLSLNLMANPHKTPKLDEAISSLEGKIKEQKRRLLYMEAEEADAIVNPGIVLPHPVPADEVSFNGSSPYSIETEEINPTNDMPNEIFYWLEQLPIKAQNCIAEFLIFDTESAEKFIKRTAPRPAPAFKHSVAGWQSSTNHLNFGYCPNNKNIAFIPSRSSQASIIDLKTEKIIQHIYLAPNKNYQLIALFSHNPKMIATVHNEQCKTANEDNCSSKGIVTIFQNCEKRMLPIPTSFICKSINFNKGGTHVILQGTDLQLTNTERNPLAPDLLFFPATTAALKDCFRQRTICRDLKNKPDNPKMIL